MPYPDSCTSLELSNNFNNFFIDKIDNIRSNFSSTLRQLEVIRHVDHTFVNFKLLTDEDVIKLIGNSPTKSCDLDPFPTSVLKQCITEIVPYVKWVINSSLSSGYFPKNCKEAIVASLLKKPGLNLVYRNYRPVSTLSYISKLIEKAVSNQIVAHIASNSLGEVLQSAYKSHHSTETALLKSTE